MWASFQSNALIKSNCSWCWPNAYLKTVWPNKRIWLESYSQLYRLLRKLLFPFFKKFFQFPFRSEVNCTLRMRTSTRLLKRDQTRNQCWMTSDRIEENPLKVFSAFFYTSVLIRKIYNSFFLFFIMLDLQKVTIHEPEQVILSTFQHWSIVFF